MDSRLSLDDDAPLGITRTFLRQAAALGLPETANARCAPLASVAPPLIGAVSRADAESGWEAESLPLACRLDRSHGSR